jgi:hypothetical protein
MSDKFTDSYVFAENEQPMKMCLVCDKMIQHDSAGVKSRTLHFCYPWVTPSTRNPIVQLIRETTTPWNMTLAESGLRFTATLCAPHLGEPANVWLDARNRTYKQLWIEGHTEAKSQLPLEPEGAELPERYYRMADAFSLWRISKLANWETNFLTRRARSFRRPAP